MIKMKVLITGASKGIGRTILKKLINEGHECIVVNRSEFYEPGLDLENLWQYDLSEESNIIQLCEKLKNYKDIQVIINNAGGGVPYKYEDITFENIKNEINLNLITPMLIIQTLFPHMKENGFGRIINISSTTAKRGTPFLFTYSAAKAGLNSLTQSIARYSIKTGITINSICPGGVETEMSINGRQEISRLLNQDLEVYQQNMIEQMGLGRLIKPEEIAELILFMLSSGANFMTGQTINACGLLEV